MSTLESKLAEPTGALASAKTPRDSAWWIIAVVFGWWFLANLPAFFLSYYVTYYVTLAGSRMEDFPTANALVSLFSALGASCVFLTAAFLRGRKLGLGDTRAGLSYGKISKRPLVVILVVVAATYLAFINFAVYIVRPDFATQIVARAAWLTLSGYVIGIVLSPVAEELFFRGWLWNALKVHWNTPLTVLVVSILWLAAHLERGVGQAILLIPVAVVLALARHFSGSVRAAIAVHVAMNLAAAAMPWIVVYH